MAHWPAGIAQSIIARLLISLFNGAKIAGLIYIEVYRRVEAQKTRFLFTTNAYVA
jgi:hypothetical protein